MELWSQMKHLVPYILPICFVWSYLSTLGSHLFRADFQWKSVSNEDCIVFSFF